MGHDAVKTPGIQANTFIDGISGAAVVNDQ
jgi:hypothetical protein